MKTLYIECKMGAAGDMLQAALYELLDETKKAEYLHTMNHLFGDAIHIQADTAAQCGIYGTHMKVEVLGQEELSGDAGHHHDHDHHHDHEHHHDHDHHHDHEHHHDHDHCHCHDHAEHIPPQAPVLEHKPHQPGDFAGQDYEPHAMGLSHDEMHMLGIPHTHMDEEAMKAFHAAVEAAAHHEHHHDHDHCHDHHHDHHGLTHEEMHALGIAHDHHHDHTHHSHYSYASICSQIENLPLPAAVKKDAAAIYRLIGDAEAKCHNSTLENIHFHEVGSLDALADVTGCSLLMYMIAPDQILVSPIHVGNGTVKCAHGILPVPAPATAEILKGIPYYTGDIMSELCTPTGAAILKHFADGFCNMPAMTVVTSGFGLGTKQFPIANGVRVFLGDTMDAAAPGALTLSRKQLPDVKKQTPELYTREYPAHPDPAQKADQILEISCNIDDMTGEELGFAMKLLLDAGALDVFYESIYMKKNRPGIKLSCFCPLSEKEKFAFLILKYTTTRGIRFQEYKRAKLESRFEIVETEYGTVRKKVSSGYGIEKSKYEYEDLRKIAIKEGISIAEVRELLR